MTQTLVETSDHQDITPPEYGEPVDVMTELQRALRLVCPSLHDHRGVALVVASILRRRRVTLHYDPPHSKTCPCHSCT